MFKRADEIEYRRERIETPDDDFLDLDWSEVESDRLLILAHGLTGGSGQWYMQKFVGVANKEGVDALAINYRSCSGETNRQKIFYHGGATYDVVTIVQHVVAKKKYKEIFLLGFSLGGNLFCKYLAENAKNLPPEIKKAAVISAPFNIGESAKLLERIENYFYMRRFLNSFKQKLRDKAAIMPGVFNLEGLDKVRTVVEFDDKYTAPVHGFSGADELYAKTSSRNLIKDIEIPLLIINAKNDPVLGPQCYPIEEAESKANIFLEMPESGGHLGFVSYARKWLETRIAEWLFK